MYVLLSSDKGIILSTLLTIRTSSHSKNIPEDRKSTWPPPSRARPQLLSLRWQQQTSWLIPHAFLFQLALALPSAYPTHGRERNKTKEDVRTDGRRFSSGRKGHPKQGRSTYRVCRNWRSSLPWIFWGRPVRCCKIVDFDGKSRHHPSRRKDQASSVDSPLLKAYPMHLKTSYHIGQKSMHQEGYICL